MRPLIDSHLDLAWNALYFNRDITQPLEVVRDAEKELSDELSRGRNTVTLPELRSANVVVCIATLMARSAPEQKLLPQAKRIDLDYPDPRMAYAHAKGQLAYYRELEKEGWIRILETRRDLEKHWNKWECDAHSTPIGVLISMEGADGILNPEQVGEWCTEGLRLVGPVHYLKSQYACGTGTSGPLTPRGEELLREMRKQGMVLDVTHLCDQSFDEALKIFEGPVLASHHNCRGLIPGDRQLTDEQIKILIERGAVIGTAFDNWMLSSDWVRGQSSCESVSLDMAVDHIDHICQLAGNASHCAIGSDLDGGFGTEQTPRDLGRYRDLHKLEEILRQRGYREEDINAIFYGNWLRFFLKVLPV